MPTRKNKSNDTAHQPQNVLQRLKNRLQQKYNALRNKHPEERRAFRKIDKEMQRVKRSKKPLTQKEIHESRGVVSTVCHEMKNEKLGTTLFNIVVGLIGTGILLVVNTKSFESIDKAVRKKIVDKNNISKSKILNAYYGLSVMIGMHMTEEEKGWCNLNSTEHVMNIRNRCDTNATYKAKIVKLVNQFYFYIMNKQKRIKADTSLDDTHCKTIARLQRSRMSDDLIGQDDGKLFTQIDEDIAKVFSGQLSFTLGAIFVAPVTEELFKFCSLKLTDKSLVPTATFAYSELLLYAYQFFKTGSNIPLNIVLTLLRFFVAPFHIKTASKMKHAPTGQEYRTLRHQMFAHFKWNSSSGIQVLKLLIHDFKKMYRGEAHTLKDTYQGVHLLLHGKTDKEIEANARSRRKRGYLQRFRKTKKAR